MNKYMMFFFDRMTRVGVMILTHPSLNRTKLQTFDFTSYSNIIGIFLPTSLDVALR